MPSSKRKKRPYGSGGYWKSANGRYKARFRLPDGRTLWHWAATEAEANRWLNEQLHLVRQGTLPASGRPRTVQEVADAWLNAISLGKARGKDSPPGPNTLAGYRRQIENYLCRPLGRHKVNELTREHILALYQWLRQGETAENRLGVAPGIKLSHDGTPLRAQTIVHLHHTLKAMFQDAVDQGTIDRHPMAGLRVPGIPTQERFAGKALTLTELRRVLDASQTVVNGASVVVAALVGCRRGEALGLTRERVHLEAETPYLTLESSLQRVRGEGLQSLPVKSRSSYRSVPLCRRLVEALEQQLAATNPSEWVFPNPVGPGPLSPEAHYRNVWTPIRLQAGLVLRPHDLRHTLNTLLVATREVPEQIISAYFGWSTTKISDHYLHLELEHKLVVAEVLDRLLED